MNSSAAVAAVYAIVRSQAMAGPNVYDMLRFSRDEETFNSLFLDQTMPNEPFIHTWMVTRRGTKSSDQNMQAGNATHLIVAMVYRSFVDGVSEPLFQAEVDAILAALYPYANRHMENEGQGIYFNWSGPPSAENVRIVMFGSVMCHTAEITFPVEEYPLN